MLGTVLLWLAAFIAGACGTLLFFGMENVLYALVGGGIVAPVIGAVGLLTGDKVSIKVCE